MIPSDNHCFLIGAFRSLRFKATFDIVGLIFTIFFTMSSYIQALTIIKLK